MVRRKAAQNCTLLPWLTATDKERFFLQVGYSLFSSEAFIKLSSGAKLLYLFMALEAKGRPEFEFPWKIARDKYDFKQTSFRAYVKELIEAGFLERKSGKCSHQPNLFRFSYQWKVGMINNDKC